MKNKIETLFRQYNIQNVSCDSRDLKPHYAFFAIKGNRFDGNEFIEDALRNASIVITDNPTNARDRVFYFEDIRLALSLASGIIYPLLPKNLIAVTGTNGKTSVVSYVYQILKLLRFQAASMGTIGIQSTRPIKQSFLDNLPKSMATYDPINFRKALNELALNGVDNVAFEASSHGIHQKRLGDLKVKTASFTSFSQDHLDYHQTMEDYLQAKLQVFVDNLDSNGLVVFDSEILNSEYSEIIKNFLYMHKIRFCLVGQNGDIKISKINSSLSGAEVFFEYNNKNYKFNTDIIGSFQATNLLIAAKMVENIGVNFDEIIDVLHKVHAVAGRLERVGKITDDFQIFVDYAHTPDALEKSLSELQKIKNHGGKLYLVFGCGGDRDNSKRYLMGQVACKLADYVIVTDDNPRSEDPAKIRADVLKGAICAKEIGKREAAIANTIEKLQRHDILLIAGKGHENYQIIGDKTLYFSDFEIAKKCLK